MAEIDDEESGRVPNWINPNEKDKLDGKGNRISPVNIPLNEFQKLAIVTMLQTGNAHKAYECLCLNPELDKREFKNSAVRTMKQLMEKPKALDYINEIRTEIEVKTQVTKDDLIKSCWEIMVLSKQHLDYSSSVKALALIAKVEGLLSKTVVDINKTVVVSFGGGFNPAVMPEPIPYTEIKNEIKNLPEESLDEIQQEKFEIKPEHYMRIKDENQGDNRIMNDR